jgi:adenylate cyclase
MAELEAGKLDGMESTRRFICVMFLDVRNFTTWSETDAPEAVTASLNALFEVATETIHRWGGTVKEFMGDGVMALFGAPQPLANASESAYRAAREILDSMAAFNAILQGRGQAPLTIGIGIACGDAVVGHIGAASRHTYGAVGDCVNLASRLEGLSKDLGYSLIMSSDLRERLDGNRDERVMSLGVRAIKGHSPVEVHGWNAEGAYATDHASR